CWAKAASARQKRRAGFMVMFILQCELKREPRVDLQFPRRITGRRNLAEIRRIDVSTRRGEVDGVGDVEDIHAEGESDPLLDGNLAAKRDVFVQNPLCGEAERRRARKIAERVGGGIDEGALIEIGNRSGLQGIATAIIAIDAYVSTK